MSSSKFLWEAHKGIWGHAIAEKTHKEYVHLRRRAQRWNQPDTIIWRESSPDSYTIIYADEFIFDGTKEEALSYLYENFAKRTLRAFDCTGRAFTQWIRVAHIAGNRWKVAERISRDI